MRRPVVSGSAIARETMPRQNNRIAIARQHLFHLFVEGSIRDRHRLAGQLVQTGSAHPSSADSPATGYVEREIYGAWLQITIDIAATERRVSFPNN